MVVPERGFITIAEKKYKSLRGGGESVEKRPRGQKKTMSAHLRTRGTLNNIRRPPRKAWQ